MTNHEDIPYIQHIMNAIVDIESFTKNLTKDKFLKDKLRQSAVVRQLEIIGEAVKNISGKTRKKYTEIKWKDIAGMRDKITHHYFGINLETVWKTIKEDLPILKKQIKDILEKESNKENK